MHPVPLQGENVLPELSQFIGLECVWGRQGRGGWRHSGAGLVMKVPGDR